MTPGDRLRAAVVSCLGLGYSPVVPGTVGSLAGVLFAFCGGSFTAVHFGLWLAAGALLGLLAGIGLGGWAEKHYGSKDPSQFVLDEFVGYCIALLRLKAGAPSLLEIASAFFLFRLFDVAKPWPARRLEFLPKGLGIMLDDVFAGLYALIVVSMLREYLDWP